MALHGFTMDRRNLLKSAGGLAATATLAGPLGMLMSQQAQAATTLGNSPYGPIYPTADLETGLELLQLPVGFSYRTMSWTGDLMADGRPVHGNHDGMACFAVGSGRNQQLVLIRNHELGPDSDFGVMRASGIYENANNVAGGNSNLYLSRGRYLETRPSLGGTVRNCMGGPTPWDTWLSCEETLNEYDEEHGFVFEVSTNPSKTTGNAIRDMGRFAHEAAAVDPATSFVYLTEDARNQSGFYRYVPNNTSQRLGSLGQGGTLQMARVVGTPNASLNVAQRGDTYQLEWVDIEEPDAAPVSIDISAGEPTGYTATTSGPFAQGFAKGGARMSRGEGIWFSTVDRLFYIVDTAGGRDSGGRAGYGNGTVFAYDPATNVLECIFSSNSAVAANNPDNITVSPRGGVVLCEDGGGVTDQFGFGERLLGLLPNGQAYALAKNNVQLSSSDIRAAGKSSEFVSPGDYRSREWCGACFSPDGRILFVNIQDPGITFAISGPWNRGNL